MQRSLTEQDLELVERTVLEQLSLRKTKTGSNQPSQALSLEFLALVAAKVVVPILISVSSSLLSEVLKGKVLARLRRNETKTVSQSMVGKPVQIDAPLTAEALNEMRTHLLPLGLKDDDLLKLYTVVQQALRQPEPVG